MRTVHCLLAVGLLLAGSPPLVAGEDLPGGAVLRLGTAGAAHRTTHPNSAAIAPDGREAAFRSGDAVVIFRPATGQTLRTFEVQEVPAAWPMAFTGDGKYLTAAGGDGFVLIDAAAGKVAARLSDPRGRGQPFAFHRFLASSDGKRAIAFVNPGRKSSIRIWDTLAGKIVGEIERDPQAIAIACALSGDGRTLAIGSNRCDPARRDGEEINEYVELWDVESRTRRARFHVGERCVPYEFHLSEDGKLLACFAEGRSRLQLWNAVDRKKIADLKKVPGVPRSTFSPSGDRFAMSTDAGHALVWDTRTGRLLAERKFNPSVQGGIGFPAADRVLGLRVEQATLKIADLLAEEKAAAVAHTGSVLLSAFSPDHRYLFTAGNDQKVLRWDLKTGTAAAAVDRPVGPGLTWNPDLMAFSPDRTVFLAGSFFGIERYDLNGKGERRILGIGGNFFPRWSSIAFSTDGKIVYARGRAQEKTPDGNKLRSVAYAAAWDAASGKILEEHAGGINQEAETLFRLKFKEAGSAFDPVGDRKLPRITLEKGEGKETLVKATAPDGAVLLAASLPVENGRGIALSGDGRFLAVPLRDPTILIFDLAKKSRP